MRTECSLHLFCLPGLKLELNIEQYEYLSELTNEAGVRVFIGHQDLMPFPYELGISARPGDSTEIMLRKVWSRKWLRNDDVCWRHCVAWWSGDNNVDMFVTEVFLQIVLGRLDPFGNKSCEEKSTVDNDSIFRRYNASYSEMVRQSVLYQ